MFDIFKKKQGESSGETPSRSVSPNNTAKGGSVSFTSGADPQRQNAPTVRNEQGHIMEVGQSTLSAPKELPELAKDLYTREEETNAANTPLSGSPVDKASSKERSFSLPNRVVEPKVGAVPQFDLSLLKGASETGTMKKDSSSNVSQISQPSQMSKNDAQAAMSDRLTPDIDSQRQHDSGYDPRYYFGYDLGRSLGRDIEYDIRRYIQQEIRSGIMDRGVLPPYPQSSSVFAPVPGNREYPAVSSGRWLFDEIEFLIANARMDEAAALMSMNIPRTLELKHGGNYSTLDELKTLERLWAYSREKESSFRSMVSEISDEIIHKSALLGSELRGRAASGSKPGHPERHGAIDGSNKSGMLNSTEIQNRREEGVMVGDMMRLLKRNTSADVSLQQNLQQNSENNFPSNNPADDDSRSRIFYTCKITLTDPSKYFYLSSGGAVRSLGELLNALRSMDDSVFYVHVNEHKNDFAYWVKGVFSDEDLSRLITAVRRKDQLISLLESFNI